MFYIALLFLWYYTYKHLIVRLMLVIPCWKGKTEKEKEKGKK